MKTQCKAIKVLVTDSDGNSRTVIKPTQDVDGNLMYNMLYGKAKRDEIVEAPLQLFKEMILEVKKLKGRNGDLNNRLNAALRREDKLKERNAQLERQLWELMARS